MSWAGPLLGSAFSTVIRSIPQLIRESKMSSQPGKMKRGRSRSRKSSSSRSRSRSRVRPRLMRKPKMINFANEAGEVTFSRVNLRKKPFLKGSRFAPTLTFKKVTSMVTTSSVGRQGWGVLPCYDSDEYINIIAGLLRTKVGGAYNNGGAAGNQAIFNAVSGGLPAANGNPNYQGIVAQIGPYFGLAETFELQIVSASTYICEVDLYFIISKEENSSAYDSTWVTNNIANSADFDTVTNPLSAYLSGYGDIRGQAYDIVGKNVTKADLFVDRFRTYKVCTVKLAAGGIHKCKFISPVTFGSVEHYFDQSTTVNLASRYFLLRCHGAPAVSLATGGAVTYSPAQVGLMVNTALTVKTQPISGRKRVVGRFDDAADAITTVADLQQIDLDDTTDGKIAISDIQ